MHTDDASKKQATMTSVCMRIKEQDALNTLAVAAHHIAISHTAECIRHEIESIIDNSGT